MSVWSRSRLGIARADVTTCAFRIIGIYYPVPRPYICDDRGVLVRGEVQGRRDEGKAEACRTLTERPLRDPTGCRDQSPPAIFFRPLSTCASSRLLPSPFNQPTRCRPSRPPASPDSVALHSYLNRGFGGNPPRTTSCDGWNAHGGRPALTMHW